MKKNLLFAWFVLCAALWSCNTIDVSDIGYGDGDRLKASQLKTVLCDGEGAWMADYQGHEFYFQFKEDGTVLLDSDFDEFTITGIVSCSTSGRAVAMNITNSNVHLEYLGAAFAENKFVATLEGDAGTDRTLLLTGATTGNTLELHPVARTYITGKVEPKTERLIQTTLLDNKVVFDANGNFVAYYSVVEDGDAYKIKVLTLENKTGNDLKGHVHYYESALTRDGRSFPLSTPISGIRSVNGATYDFSAVEFGSGGMGITGMTGITIVSNNNAATEFDYALTGQKYSMNKRQGKGDACEEIWEETGTSWEANGIPFDDMHLEGIDNMYDRVNNNCHPLVVWRNYWANIVYPGSEPGASLLMNDVDKDLILFREFDPIYKGMGYYAESTPEDCEKIKTQAMPNLFSTWFNAKGLFVVRQKTGGKTFMYLLCPDTEATPHGGMWMKWEAQ